MRTASRLSLAFALAVALAGCSSTKSNLPLHIDLTQDWNEARNNTAQMDVWTADQPTGQKVTWAGLVDRMHHQPFVLAVGVAPNRSAENDGVNKYFVEHGQELGLPVVGVCAYCLDEDMAATVQALPSRPYVAIVSAFPDGPDPSVGKEHAFSMTNGIFLVDGDGVVRAGASVVPSAFNVKEGFLQAIHELKDQ